MAPVPRSLAIALLVAVLVAQNRSGLARSARRLLVAKNSTLTSEESSSGAEHARQFSSECLFDADCNHGTCRQRSHQTPTWQCECNEPYTSADDEICNYKQKNKLTAFLLSIFVGWFGADWFYLARGHAAYIVAGIFKLLTAGGLGVWWLVDWIRILTDSFSDGNGVPLADW